MTRNLISFLLSLNMLVPIAGDAQTGYTYKSYKPNPYVEALAKIVKEHPSLTKTIRTDKTKLHFSREYLKQGRVKGYSYAILYADKDFDGVIGKNDQLILIVTDGAKQYVFMDQDLDGINTLLEARLAEIPKQKGAQLFSSGQRTRHGRNRRMEIIDGIYLSVIKRVSYLLKNQ